jgi:hypothetical protein
MGDLKSVADELDGSIDGLSEGCLRQLAKQLALLYSLFTKSSMWPSHAGESNDGIKAP